MIDFWDSLEPFQDLTMPSEPEVTPEEDGSLNGLRWKVWA